MRSIDADELKKAVINNFDNLQAYFPKDFIEEINNAPTVEPKELKRVRDICEHWNDNSSSFVSACNAFEDILHIFKMGVGDIRGDNNETN